MLASARPRALRLSSALALALACACGGSPTRAPEAAAAPTASAASDIAAAPSASSGEAPSAAPPPALPTTCAGEGDHCRFPVGFVDRLCTRQYVEATLALFANPVWTRAYLRGTVEGWNASGGTSLRATLAFDEEVIVLRHRRAPKNSIVVGDEGGFDVLRWDGYCYSLDAAEVTLKPPPRARRALIPFFKIGKSMQEALLSNPAVTKAYAKRMKECGGATQGEVTLTCEKANTALSNAATDFIVSGAKLPTPAKIP